MNHGIKRRGLTRNRTTFFCFLRQGSSITRRYCFYGVNILLPRRGAAEEENAGRERGILEEKHNFPRRQRVIFIDIKRRILYNIRICVYI